MLDLLNLTPGAMSAAVIQQPADLLHQQGQVQAVAKLKLLMKP
ncbi:MAG: hypothetical protein OEZ06_28055 [Myxococcales bacterium]|nr:hypothetical protein [Myxococcales bacterium]